MKNLLLGGIIGYSLCWLCSTPQGNGFLGNTQRGISSLQAKIGKDVDTKPKDEKKVEEGDKDENDS